jgi:hypothetical protein
MLIAGKVYSQAKSFSPSQTKLIAIIAALAVTVLLVLASVKFGPVLLPGTTVEQQWIIGP